MRWEHPRPARSAGKVDDQVADVSFFELHKAAIIGLAVLGVLVAAAVVYSELPNFSGGVASTTQTTGKVTAVQNQASVVASNNQVVPPVTRITLTVGSASFDTVLSCSSASYKVGQTVKVADQLMHDGSHTYVADLACVGQTSPYNVLFPPSTTTSTSSSHSTSSTSTTTTTSASTSTSTTSTTA